VIELAGAAQHAFSKGGVLGQQVITGS